MTLPNELKEAAFIEGIGNVKFLFSVVIPYCKTSFITLEYIVFNNMEYVLMATFSDH